MNMDLPFAILFVAGCCALVLRVAQVIIRRDMERARRRRAHAHPMVRVVYPTRTRDVARRVR